MARGTRIGLVTSAVAALAASACDHARSASDDPRDGAGDGGALSGGGAGSACAVDACPVPDAACEVAACEDGACATGSADAGTPCSDGVCDGAGACVRCLPGTRTCVEGVPHVCGTDDAWQPLDECRLHSRCDGGRCRSIDVEWLLHATSVASNEMLRVATDAQGGVTVTGWFQTDLTFGEQTLAEPGTTDVFVTRVPSAGGRADSLIQLGSGGRERFSALSVAPDGAHFVMVQASGAFTRGPAASRFAGETEPFTPVLGFRPNGALSFEQNFRTLEPLTIPLTLPFFVAATPSGSTYAALEFVDGVRWLPPMSPFENVDLPGCHTLLTELDGAGSPLWWTTYDWCYTAFIATRPVALIGTDGNLYLAGQSGSRNGDFTEPSVLGTHVLESVGSGLFVKVNPRDGGVLGVEEVCTSGNVLALANGAGDELVALMDCPSAELSTTGAPELFHVLRLNHDLEILDHRVVAESPGLAATSLAVNPEGEIFVGGSMFLPVDFGAGLHDYQGSCEDCDYGDAFLIGFRPDLTLLFSETSGSASEEWVSSLAADATHLYVTMNLGASLEIQGRPLAASGAGTSSVLVKYALR